MRKNLEDMINEDEHVKLMRLLSVMAEYDASEDSVHKERLIEEIRNIKKELLSKLALFKNIDCIVAGDKDAEKAELVVCADATSGAFRVKGTVEVPCSVCGTMVLLSPDSPKAPPKACFTCAVKLGEQKNLDDEQDSLGA